MPYQKFEMKLIIAIYNDKVRINLDYYIWFSSKSNRISPIDQVQNSDYLNINIVKFLLKMLSMISQ